MDLSELKRAIVFYIGSIPIVNEVYFSIEDNIASVYVFLPNEDPKRVDEVLTKGRNIINLYPEVLFDFTVAMESRYLKSGLIEEDFEQIY